MFSYPFSKIFFFLFSLLQRMKARVFRKNAISLMISCCRKLFLPFGSLTLILVNTKIFMETHDKPMEQERCFGFPSIINYGIHKIRLERHHLEINNEVKFTQFHVKKRILVFLRKYGVCVFFKLEFQLSSFLYQCPKISLVANFDAK